VQASKSPLTAMVRSAALLAELADRLGLTAALG
jgi:hypothetical protein